MKYQMKIILLLLFSQSNNFSDDQPIVCIPSYRGLLGNQIYQFCAAKILSEELKIPLQCPSIFGFPETRLYNIATFNKNLSDKIINRKNFAKTIENNLNITEENFIIKDDIFLYANFIKYKNEIKKWLKFERPLKFQKNPDDIVLHIRIYTKTRDLNYRKLLPMSFYDQVLSSTKYDQVYICTNEPNHPYIQNFKKYNPIIKSTTSLHEALYEKKMGCKKVLEMNFEEFKFITSFNKIVIALSTFSWWAAFLSEGSEIFVPTPTSFKYHLDYPDEDRYKFINVNL